MTIKHLLKSKDFIDIFKSGKKITGKTLNLYFSRDDNNDGLFIGIVVPKRLARKAVTRNFVRRLIYGNFRAKAMLYDNNLRIIIKITVNIETYTKKQLSLNIRDELEALSRKAKILR